MSILEHLIESEFTPEGDEQLFDYAERWLASNAFLADVDLWPMFTSTVGYRQYVASGTVPPEDD